MGPFLYNLTCQNFIRNWNLLGRTLSHIIYTEVFCQFQGNIQLLNIEICDKNIILTDSQLTIETQSPHRLSDFQYLSQKIKSNHGQGKCRLLIQTRFCSQPLGARFLIRDIQHNSYKTRIKKNLNCAILCRACVEAIIRLNTFCVFAPHCFKVSECIKSSHYQTKLTFFLILLFLSN